MLTLILLGFTTEVASVHKVQLDALAPGGASFWVAPPPEWQLPPSHTGSLCIPDGAIHDAMMTTNVLLHGRRKDPPLTQIVSLFVDGEPGERLTGVCSLVDTSGALVQLQYDVTIVAGTPLFGTTLVPTERVHPPTD